MLTQHCRLWAGTIVLLCTPFLFICGCRKTDQSVQRNTSQTDTQLTQQFFNTSGTIDPVVNKVIQKLKRYPDYIPGFVSRNGLAVWNKAIVTTARTSRQVAGSQQVMAAGNTGTSTNSVALIPLVRENENQVKNMLACLVQGDSVMTMEVVKGNNYQWYTEHVAQTGLNGEGLSLLLMKLDQAVFGHERFWITDTALFRHDSRSAAYTYISLPKDQPSVAVNSTRVEHVCVEVKIVKWIPRDNGQLGGCPAGQECFQYVPEYSTETYCEWVFIYDISNDPGDDGGGGGDPGGGWPGGGTGDPPVGDPCGGSPTGEPGNYPPCTGIDPPWIPEPPPNEFYGLTNPIDAPDDPVIENGITLSELPASDTFPSGRSIAKTEARNNREDMISGYNEDSSGIMVPLNPGTTVNVLFDKMSSLFAWCTFFDNQLWDVGKLMIKRFRENSGLPFSNPVLNKKVAESAAFLNFAKRVLFEIDDSLKKHGDNINLVQIPVLRYRPIFNGLHNKFYGLQILLNDTEETEVFLDNFVQNPVTKEWSADVTFVIKDHFGLDKNDAIKYQSWHDGFAMWWLLQHRRGYKPFETVVTIKRRVHAKRP